MIKKQENEVIEKRRYISVDLEICLWEREDVITLSPSDDEMSDDIFG